MNRLVMLLVGATGALLLFGATTDRKPSEILGALLTGSTLPEAGSWTNTLGGKSLNPLPNIPKGVIPSIPDLTKPFVPTIPKWF